MFWKRYLLGTALAVMSLQTLAAAPQVKNPAPGFYRIMLGSYEVTALSDGVLRLPVEKLLLNSSPKQIETALAERHQKQPVVTSVNAYLINTGSKLILIDTGAGKLLGNGVGKLVANLKAAGYQPQQVDEIYLTHLHPDHLGGLSQNGKAVFPNAVVRASQQDADFWLSESRLKQAKSEDRASFERAMAAIKPYQAAGHFKSFSSDGELSRGISAFAAHGHTPGHSIYLVERSEEQRLNSSHT